MGKEYRVFFPFQTKLFDLSNAKDIALYNTKVRPLQLTKHEKRTDWYVNLSDPNLGLKLRGANENKKNFKLELKIRTGTSAVEKWKKLVSSDIIQRDGQSLRDCMLATLASQASVSLVADCIRRLKLFNNDQELWNNVWVIEKQRWQHSSISVEQTDIKVYGYVARQGEQLYRSIAFEGDLDEKAASSVYAMIQKRHQATLTASSLLSESVSSSSSVVSQSPSSNSDFSAASLFFIGGYPEFVMQYSELCSKKTSDSKALLSKSNSNEPARL